MVGKSLACSEVFQRCDGVVQTVSAPDELMFVVSPGFHRCELSSLTVGTTWDCASDVRDQRVALHVWRLVDMVYKATMPYLWTE